MSKKRKNSDTIAALNNEYTKEQYAEFQKQQKQLIFKRRRLAVIFLIAMGIFIVSGIQLFGDFRELESFKKQKAEVVAESVEMDKKLTDLEQDVALLKDNDYVAKLARSRYYVSKDGEQVYTIPELGSSELPANEATEPSNESQTQSQPSE